METQQDEFSLSSSFQFKSYYVVWKLASFISGVNAAFSFKSYYVVWKLIVTQCRKKTVFCLNRTMQYGNSNLTATIFFDILLFKSYYVVWKQKHLFNTFTPSKRFKSYYVVWKLNRGSFEISVSFSLNRTMQYGNYSFFSQYRNTAYRLNRTMQYGNPSLQFYDGLTTLFKSYYVVWKLTFILELVAFRAGLNRTMQYGNGGLTEDEIDEEIV